ncbi:bifunctional diaminohydroxyphosphoribosylaminopyrimidine deaminase/5-amino-6-(5-phosphoribosylamino)uracil reductase RibD [Aneurinibacillus terranovensis]|uniref:bifunctional diaminohydroxyphosphoribosylaminopyrimidine deaminase/5-amino-6-(5-phosphoribosylamino)uracil reductase RibD n=1 Tax=Aneurinibacillus terranovensis TaxID=278991 RepID=UPI00041396A5|nr:bifunctional diaminohydroxyphosphoribosylaminopyrimidine deaminase/5-amino-6-(5-phosphoribosylamino)uracil reductase RibD [Aneurinibacillus terranovensis]
MAENQSPQHNRYENDEHYMKLALQLAEATRGQTSPNPMVGCVIVKDRTIIGVGSHLKAGEAHAEILALAMAGDKARGATAYVTLEPCSHHGRTPPCAEALIREGVSRVVIAMLDPNPLVAGQGAQKLEEAGIQVITGVCEAQARQLNEVFSKFITTGLPFVTVKTAMTLDGKVATETGNSRWITGEAARLDVHRIRHEHDAILVGIGTVLQDNPQLTTRLPNGGKNPLRVILDSALRVPPEAHVVRDGQAPTWIFTTSRACPDKRKLLERQGLRVLSAGAGDQVDIAEVMRILGKENITSLFVEGGSQINSAFLHARAIDKVITYVAPKIVAGQTAPSPFGGPGIEEMSRAISLADITVEKISEDIKISGYPVWR